MGKTEELAQALLKSISELWVIDSHEHLVDETDRLAAHMDAVSAFVMYPKWPIQVAGMSQSEFNDWTNTDLPLDQRWAIFEKYLPAIRMTSVVQSVLLGIRELYGFSDVNRDNYKEVTAAIQAANKPGIYRRVFFDHGRIVAILNELHESMGDAFPARGNVRLPQMWEGQLNPAFGPEPLERMERELDQPITSLAAFADHLPELLARFKKRGVLAIKLGKTVVGSRPQAGEAAPIFDKVMRFRDKAYDRASALAREQEIRARFVRNGIPPELPGQPNPLLPAEAVVLRDYVFHAMLQAAGELGLVAIHHSGYNGTWADYRVTRPSDLIPVFRQYPQVRFEIYHAGTLWARDQAMVALAFPNVWLNQCWAHALARRMAETALDEWFDIVPANKIIAYGGDTFVQLEATLGDLIQVRHMLANVLAKRVSAGILSEQQALDIARMLLHDNSRDLYHLQLGAPGSLTYA